MEIINDPVFDELEAAQEAMNIPRLSAAWLGVLSDDGGLPDVSTIGITHKGKPLFRRVESDPANTPRDHNTFPARLDSGQVVWVKLDQKVVGQPSVYVVDKPSQNKAALAALILMECRPVDIQNLEEFLSLLDFSDPEKLLASADEVSSRILFREAFHEELLDRGLAFRCISDKALPFATALLRYYRPDFDTLREEEKISLIIECCKRLNSFLDSTRQLAEFLEYGTPNRDQRKAVENPARDVKAAVLRDVHGMSHRLIAERLNVVITDKASAVGDFSTIGKMVSRGRNVLDIAFSENNWNSQAAALRSEWSKHSILQSERGALDANACSLSEDVVVSSARRWGISFEHAKNILESKSPLPHEVSHKFGPMLPLTRAYYSALASDEGKSI